ncbi:MAG: DUF5658 family protein [Halobaculum sp.]
MTWRAYLRLSDTRFSEREFTRLWTVALATYGVGDIVTTLAVIRLTDRIGEANPLVRVAVAQYGETGLIALKLAVFGLCLALSLSSARADDRWGYYLPPALLALVGGFTTALNLRLLVG